MNVETRKSGLASSLPGISLVLFVFFVEKWISMEATNIQTPPKAPAELRFAGMLRASFAQQVFDVLPAERFRIV